MRSKFLLTVIFTVLTYCNFSLCLDICESETCDCHVDTADCKQRNISKFDEILVIPTYVAVLDFSGNHISNLQDLNLDIKSEALQKLDLSSNSFENLQFSTYEIFNSTLTDLNLRNNIINSLTKETFDNVQSLVRLDLSFNQLSSLPDGLFQRLSRLELLDLSFNPISVLHESTFMNLASLKIINLAFLQLEDIHSQIFDWNMTVTDLNLSYNFFTSVPTKALWYLRKTLKTFTFSGNSLEIMSTGSFFGLSELRVLQLEQHLQLRRIEAYAFKDLANLETFVLRYLPKIQRIHPKAFHVNESESSIQKCPVRDFSLEFTTLSALPQDLLVWDDMRYVSLTNNRWYCDCDMKWIKDTSLENRTGNSIHCSGPLRYRGQNTKSMKEEEFTCVTLYVTTPSGVMALFGIVIFAIIISFTTVLILVYQRNGWICNPPRVPYDKIDSPLNTITIFDRSTDTLAENDGRYREMVYIHDG